MSDSNGYSNPEGQQSPFKLVEDILPTRAKNGIRAAYGIIGIAAIILGIALLVWPGRTLVVATVIIGIYFLISGVVRIVSSIVELGLPGGWRVLGVIVGILLIIAGIVCLKYVTMSAATLTIMFTIIVGIGWIMEGIMSLTEVSGSGSGWGIAYGIISIIAGFVLLCMPLASTVWLILFGAIALVVMGVFAVIRAFTFGRGSKQAA